jgi:hypothetical protein
MALQTIPPLCPRKAFELVESSRLIERIGWRRISKVEAGGSSFTLVDDAGYRGSERRLGVFERHGVEEWSGVTKEWSRSSEIGFAGLCWKIGVLAAGGLVDPPSWPPSTTLSWTIGSRRVLALCSDLLLGGRMHNDPDPTGSIQSKAQIDGRNHILIL